MACKHSDGPKEGHGPVKHSIRQLSEPQAEAIGVEVNRLLDANFIREIKESEWLTNTVMVPKKDADVRGLHIAEQALPKGSLPSSSDRSDHRFDCRL